MGLRSSCAAAWFLGSVACLALPALSGCAVVESVGDATKQTLRMFKPRPDDWDPSADKDADWNWVGDETRQHYGRERDPDRWYKKYIMSEKANAIERNFGID